MRPTFEAAPFRYDPLQEGRFREQVATAIAKTVMRGENADLGGADYVLTSPDGTQYAVRADDSGLVYLVNLATGASQPLPATDADLTALAALEAADVAALDARIAAFEPRVSMRAVRASSAQALTAGSTTTLLFNSEELDTDNAYDPATGFFTAPSAGRYLVVGSAGVSFASAGASSQITIEVGGVIHGIGIVGLYAATAAYGTVSAIVSLTAGQSIRLRVSVPTGAVSPALAVGLYSRLTIERLGD